MRNNYKFSDATPTTKKELVDNIRFTENSLGHKDNVLTAYSSDLRKSSFSQ